MIKLSAAARRSYVCCQVALEAGATSTSLFSPFHRGRVCADASDFFFFHSPGSYKSISHFSLTLFPPILETSNQSFIRRNTFYSLLWWFLVVLSGVLSFWKHPSIHHPLSARWLFLLDFFFKNTTVSQQQVKNISPSALSYMRRAPACWRCADYFQTLSILQATFPLSSNRPTFFLEKNKPGSEESSEEPLYPFLLFCHNL